MSGWQHVFSGWQNASRQSSSKRLEDSRVQRRKENCKNNKWKKRRERENAETAVGKNAEREGEQDWKEE